MKNKTNNIFYKWNAGDYFTLVAMVIMFTPTFYRLVTLGWKSADYTHAYFILPISLWFIFGKRDVLIKSDAISKSGVILLILGVIFYLFAALNAFMFLEAFSFVLVMWAIFRLRLKKESFKKILFPLTYLLFLIPPPAMIIDMATLPLRKISTYGSYFLLSMLQLPVKVYGAILRVGEHDLFITDACSGFRSMVTLLALGAVYAYSQGTSLRKKWIIFLFVIPLGIFGNILRITATGVISYFAGIEYAEGFFHTSSGIFLFIFTVLGLVAFTGFICKKPISTQKNTDDEWIYSDGHK